MPRPCPRLVLLAVLALLLAVPVLGFALGAGAADTNRAFWTEGSSTVPVGEIGVAWADCPYWEARVVSASVSFQGATRSFRFHGSYLHATTRAIVYARNVGGGTLRPLPVEATALCLRSTTGVTVKEEGRTVAAGRLSTEAIDCPSGTLRVGGGGFGLGVPVREVPTPLVLASYPIAGGWATKFVNTLEGARDVGVLVQASCATRAALGGLVTEDVTRRVEVASGALQTIFVRCPRGAEVAAGGFILPSSGAVLLERSMPDIFGSLTVRYEGWEVAVLNRSPRPEVVDAYAVCLRPLPLISDDGREGTPRAVGSAPTFLLATRRRRRRRSSICGQWGLITCV